MRNYFIILLFSVSTLSTGCGSIKYTAKTPGTVEVTTDTYIKAVETTVLEWMEFIAANNFDLSLFPDPEIIKSQPYSLLFTDLRLTTGFKYLKTKKNSFGLVNFVGIKLQPSKENNRISKSHLLPITGITYEQAIKFCKWKESFINKNRPSTEKVSIQLPSINLYKIVIQNTDSINIKECKDKGCRSRYNYLKAECCDNFKQSQNYIPGQDLVRVDAFWPNDFKVYCIQGNAAEMTETKGIAMGGSYRHFAKQTFNDQTQTYSKPEEWLGFRYVVTIQR